MDIPSSSDFSSGCESGWTTYLNQSSPSRGPRRTGGSMIMCGDYKEEVYYKGYGEGEDLSMVSDASSGPRNYNGDDDCGNPNDCSSIRNSNKMDNKKAKLKKNVKQRDRSSQLDDTASSHGFDYSKNMQSSMRNTSSWQDNNSTTPSKGKSSRKKYFGL